MSYASFYTGLHFLNLHHNKCVILSYEMYQRMCNVQGKFSVDLYPKNEVITKFRHKIFIHQYFN